MTFIFKGSVIYNHGGVEGEFRGPLRTKVQNFTYLLFLTVEVFYSTKEIRGMVARRSTK